MDGFVTLPALLYGSVKVKLPLSEVWLAGTSPRSDTTFTIFTLYGAPLECEFNNKTECAAWLGELTTTVSKMITNTIHRLSSKYPRAELRVIAANKMEDENESGREVAEKIGRLLKEKESVKVQNRHIQQKVTALKRILNALETRATLCATSINSFSG